MPLCRVYFGDLSLIGGLNRRVFQRRGESSEGASGENVVLVRCAGI